MRKGVLFVGLVSWISADELQPMGDEFGDAGSLSQWQDLGVVEGWGTPSVEEHDIHLTTPGRFRIQPGALTWFRHLRGALFFKEVSGDFVVTAKLRILSRHNPADSSEVPNRSFSLSGLLIHGPRSITQAAPDPYTTEAVWPPADFGSDYVANTENYIFLAYGTAGDAGTRQFEIKATRNSNSRLYFSANGVSGNEVWLQMARVGNTVVCLRKHSAGGEWLVENRYPNADHPFPDFGETLQVGLTAYTDWPTARPFNNAGLEESYHFNYAPPGDGNPDLISEVDFFRLQRPAAALTEAVLQGMSVSYDPSSDATADPPVTLATSVAAAPHLGDRAHRAVGRLSVEDVVVREVEGVAEISVVRSGAAEGEVTVDFSTLDGSASGLGDFTASNGTLTWADGISGAQIINIPIVDDGLGEGLERFLVRLDGLSGPANFAAGQLSREVLVTITESAYDDWRLSIFGNQAYEDEAGAMGDFDFDGVVNLLEFALASDPTFADPSVMPRYSATTNGAEFRFIPGEASTAVTMEIESSGDLVEESWTVLATREAGQTSWVESGEEVSVSVNEVTGEVTLSDRIDPNTSRFLRLRVVLGE